MKKKLLTLLLAVAVAGSATGGLFSVEAKAAENSNYASDEKEDFSVKYVRADYFDFANKDHLEVAGHATVGNYINFTAESKGGVGKITYQYYITSNKPGGSYYGEISSSPDFLWVPDSRGEYLVAVIAYDEAGHTTSTGALYFIVE